MAAISAFDILKITISLGGRRPVHFDPATDCRFHYGVLPGGLGVVRRAAAIAGGRDRAGAPTWA